MKIALTLLALLILPACKFEVSYDGPPTRYKCKDLRDGEVFYWHTDHIQDAYTGLNGAGFSVTDEGGKRWHFTKASQAYIKCEECPQKGLP